MVNRDETAFRPHAPRCVEISEIRNWKRLTSRASDSSLNAGRCFGSSYGNRLSYTSSGNRAVWVAASLSCFVETVVVSVWRFSRRVYAQNSDQSNKVRRVRLKARRNAEGLLCQCRAIPCDRLLNSFPQWRELEFRQEPAKF
jgi:hypothetical protein